MAVKYGKYLNVQVRLRETDREGCNGRILQDSRKGGAEEGMETSHHPNEQQQAGGTNKVTTLGLMWQLLVRTPVMAEDDRYDGDVCRCDGAKLFRHSTDIDSTPLGGIDEPLL